LKAVRLIPSGLEQAIINLASLDLYTKGTNTPIRQPQQLLTFSTALLYPIFAMEAKMHDEPPAYLLKEIHQMIAPILAQSLSGDAKNPPRRSERIRSRPQLEKGTRTERCDYAQRWK
jgi:hypothetical protein